jgi:hypothetical protein
MEKASPRFIPNTYKDWEENKSFAIRDMIQAIQGEVPGYVAKLIENYPPSSNLSITSVPAKTAPGYDIYSGSGGNAYLYWLISKVSAGSPAAQEYIEHAKTALRVSISTAEAEAQRTASFFCGAAGLYALGCVICPEEKSVFASFLLEQNVSNLIKHDELLYGKAGYLYALLFVERHCPELTTLLSPVILDVFAKLIRNTTSEGRLSVEFYRKRYLGGAHGLLGVLQALMLCMKTHEATRTDETAGLIRASLDYLLSVQTPEGNFPTNESLGNDKLVHFCHGATGAVMTLTLAFQTFNDTRYMDAARKAADHIWTRGLLVKGNALCHGISGNGYAFLALYRATLSEKWLYRALMFLDATFDEGVLRAQAEGNDVQRDIGNTPDHPYSLGEGGIGELCYAVDLCLPEYSAFPGYEL